MNVFENLSNKLTYSYIKNIKRWMECPVCHRKMIFEKGRSAWVCNDCSYALPEEEFLDDFVFWFCDGCNEYLNVQDGFDRKRTNWVCTKCGFDNDITFANLRGQCKDCGKLLMNPDATICSECKTIRMRKAKAVLDSVADFCEILKDALQSNDSHSQQTYDFIECDEDDEEEEIEWKCANCGCTDLNSLWDEDDTFYCSRCQHRTSKITGKDDVVECPYCHRMRDRKAMYCRYCNDSVWMPSTKEEFEEIDKDLKKLGY